VTDDPYQAWRHLDGTRITVSEHELVEDTDGLPAGVERTETTAVLFLPPIPEVDDE